MKPTKQRAVLGIVLLGALAVGGLPATAQVQKAAVRIDGMT